MKCLLCSIPPALILSISVDWVGHSSGSLWVVVGAPARGFREPAVWKFEVVTRLGSTSHVRHNGRLNPPPQPSLATPSHTPHRPAASETLLKIPRRLLAGPDSKISSDTFRWWNGIPFSIFQNKNLAVTLANIVCKTLGTFKKSWVWKLIVKTLRKSCRILTNPLFKAQLAIRSGVWWVGSNSAIMSAQ